ncbi:SIMPL domain-containing protein [Sphingomonas baiyangensis]|uniref:DUF541 domain-containing protein n=1 Tax=Sphingomonas baiyangensis TaxID=2572576 RepID=A0A4U1L591_9SPHN|nr:SIMPL domain-containing protein [Sphingomonas baiyangensis]TKD51972.1 DUF541 domain-containing protein [Sphingomonas baiyangensis]
MRILMATAMLLGASAAAAQTAPMPTTTPLLPEGALLDVVAEGRSTRTPDQATIEAGVVTQASTAAEAMRANAERIERVLAALKRAGVADRDVRTAQISLSPQYRYGENQPPIITGYQASNRVSIRFRDVARSGAILDALVKEGANQIEGPNLGLTQPDAAMDEARSDAVARARARAELYAKAAGLRVERIAAISEGGAPPVGGPVPQMAMARMEAADTKVVPGEQEIVATVHVRFVLR